MTKRELINQLENIPVSDNTLIVLQKDAEGNGYSPLSGCERAIYIAEETWWGEVYNPDWSSEDAGLEEDEWEQLKTEKDKQCIVLWPVH